LPSDDLRDAIREIKLRAPIEEVVRERVPGLKRAGALWEAVCPFHEEKTPSFKVDPRKGTWHCYGSCSNGGDQLDFLMEFLGVQFMEALELLAAQTAVELPKAARTRGPREPLDPLLEAVERTCNWYERKLHSPAGKAGLDYLRARGLEEGTLKAFSVGFAPPDGQALVGVVSEEQLDIDAYLKAGLVRRNDSGRSYDFFRGRLTFPIRDLAGRPLGFGARRLLDDEGSGPKYVNTPETELFHKGRLIYGLDRAREAVRKGGHLVLVEGYTDVMAAHQVGRKNVAAVLGTSTTADHAGLVRRVGAKRVTLVFDGDAAGRQAAERALKGLLALDIELEVAALEQGTDPCDLLIREGAEAFDALLAGAQGWFDFVTAGIEHLGGGDLSRAVDGCVEFLACLRRPVHREALLAQLAERTGLAQGVLREQFASHPLTGRGAVGHSGGHTGGRTSEARSVRGKTAPLAQAADEAGSTNVPERRQPTPEERRLVGAYARLLGAILLDNSLAALVRPWLEGCPEPRVSHALVTFFELYDSEDGVISEGLLLSSLLEHPARPLVIKAVELASTAETPRELVNGELRFLEENRIQTRRAALTDAMGEAQRRMAAGDEQAEEHWRAQARELTQLGNQQTESNQTSPSTQVLRADAH
jgi:DNA primase